MLQNLLPPRPTGNTDSLRAWAVLRVCLALLIAAHGWARWWAGGVSPFGTFLQSQGLPAGWLLAIAVTALEVLGSVALALGWGVRPLCLAFALVYGTGIALVHAAQGWFVVGLGRNGSEYSVLLIVCLLLVAWQSPARASASAASPPDQPA